MRMFILRRGIGFYAEQDSYGYRKEFLTKVCEHNMLDMKLDSIDYFLCDGQGLFSSDLLVMTTGYFPKNYRAYRDQAGDLSHVVLTYSFNVQSDKMEVYPISIPAVVARKNTSD